MGNVDSSVEHTNLPHGVINRRRQGSYVANWLTPTDLFTAKI